MNKSLVSFSILIILFLSCKKKSTPTEENEITHSQIITNSITEITSGVFIGNKVGKVQYQLTFGGTLNTDNLSGNDTLQFVKYGVTSDSNITLVEKGNNTHTFEMKLCDTNFVSEYILFSFRDKASTELFPPTIQYEDHYCTTSGKGPEAELIYYYNKDSLVYFRNDCANLYSGAGNPAPYNNYYLISFTKRY